MAKVKGRAESPGEKRAVVERILVAWSQVPDLRLAQFIFNATNGRDIFYNEDASFVETLENYAASYKRN